MISELTGTPTMGCWDGTAIAFALAIFVVDRIDANGSLHAECHRLDYDETLRLAVREISEHVIATVEVPALVAGAEVVVAFTAGTFRWRRLCDGKEILAPARCGHSVGENGPRA